MLIAVTGAKGFIGSVCTARFTDRGHQVIPIDDYSRGLNDTERVTRVVKADCRDGIGYLLKREKRLAPDAVVHLAAATGSLERPLEELRDLNVEMTKAIYQEACELGVKAFVFPVTSLALTVPDSPYVISKEEAVDWLFKNQGSTNLIPLRFFNVAGAYRGFTERRRREVHLIPGIVECYKKHEPLLINGGDYETVDGTPSREFVNVVDVADFILYLIQRTVSAYPNARRFDKPLQVGTGRPATVLEIVQEFNRSISRLNLREPLPHVETKMGPRRLFDCGVLHCTEPNLWFFKKPVSWKASLHQEVTALVNS